MEIIYEPTKNYKFVLAFEFSQDIIDVCREIKDEFGSDSFSFINRKWRFTKSGVIDRIVTRFPEIKINEAANKAIMEQQIFEINSAQREKTLFELKDKKTTDFKVNGINREPFNYQKIGIEFMIASGGKCILADEMGLGKQLAVDTKILTEKGWIEIGDIKIGDIVFGRDGKKTKVTGVYPQGVNPLYEMMLSDGSSCLCGLEHQWSVRDKNMVKRNQGWKVLTTKELLKRKLLANDGKSRYMIPFCSPPKTAKKDFLIKPYTLGALLGDGCLNGTSILISIPKEKEIILEKIKREHPEYDYVKSKNPSCPQFRFTKRNKNNINYLKREIIRFNLNIKSKERFIPEDYKTSSVEQRLDMLKGLMDTDGSNSRGRVTFHTCSERLAYDVSEIVKSLGGNAKIRVYDRSKEQKPIEFQVNVRSYLFLPFSKNIYKAKNLKLALYGGKNGRYIKSLKYKEDKEAICISVDNKESLYVIQDYIVTHNTLQSLGYITHTKQKKTLVICPASVKYGFNLEVEKWTDLKSIIINSKDTITPEMINDNDVFIINYDIMKIFFNTEVKEVYNKAKGKKEKKKSFKIKPLFKLFKFDCVVCDEVHMIKNSSAIRSQLVKKIVSQVESIILMSGTIILNRPVEIFNALNLIDPDAWNNWFNFTKRYCNGHQGNFGWDFSGSSNLDELKQKIGKYFLRRTKEEVNADLPPKRRIDIPVELNKAYAEEYSLAEDSFKRYLKEVKKASDEKIAKSLNAEHLGKLNALRQITSRGKIEAAKELIQSIIDSGEKAVIFSVYNEPLEALKEHFKDISVSITGKTPMEERGSAIKAFQEDDSIRLFLGGMKSAGAGITLTSGQNVVLVDFPFVPGEREQAINRIHRFGQKASKVTIYQLYAHGTIDEKMKEILKGKEVIFNKLIENNKGKSLSDINTSLIGDLLKVF